MLSTVSLPPSSDTLVYHIPADASWHELHSHAQYFDILVSALVIKKQHLLIFYPAVPVYALEMRCFVAGVDLQVVEVVNRSARGAR